jgi:hypothetical protein
MRSASRRDRNAFRSASSALEHMPCAAISSGQMRKFCKISADVSTDSSGSLTSTLPESCVRHDIYNYLPVLTAAADLSSLPQLLTSSCRGGRPETGIDGASRIIAEGMVVIVAPTSMD